MLNHYNQAYFNWQKNIGAFGGLINRKKFTDFIKADDKIIDFGCGGGFLLANIACKEKIGIELNASARASASKIGIQTVEKASEIQDEWADVIISNNALEHTYHPLQELKNLYPKLKKGGKIVFVVPCENITYHYQPNDINQHVYSWSPMCLGNLFNIAGFKVLSSKPYIHKWPPHYMAFRRILGDYLFHLLCRLWARIERTWFQVQVVAIKE